MHTSISSFKGPMLKNSCFIQLYAKIVFYDQKIKNLLGDKFFLLFVLVLHKSSNQDLNFGCVWDPRPFLVSITTSSTPFHSSSIDYLQLIEIVVTINSL